MGEDWRGIRRHGAGWQATVSQGRGRPKLTRQFPLETEPRTMQQWRADERARLRLKRKQRASMGTFAGDAARYLRLVTTLPTYKDRVRDIGLWVQEFGTTRRDRITSADILAIRNRWLTQDRAEKKPPLAPATVNKRLRALSNLYTVLDGSQAINPVRDVPEAKEPDPEPRALDYQTIAAILAALPDKSRPEKGQKRGTVSKTKIRLRCLAYSQITPKQLGALTPADIDLNAERVRLPARVKGRGAKAIWVSLLPLAVDAFRDFVAHDCFGRFSVSSVRHSWHRAIKLAGLTLPGARVYDLRHSFATLAYEATQSLEAVAKLMQHRSAKTTQRYAAAADALVLERHSRTVARHFGTTPQAPKKNH